MGLRDLNKLDKKKLNRPAEPPNDMKKVKFKHHARVRSTFPSGGDGQGPRSQKLVPSRLSLKKHNRKKKRGEKGYEWWRTGGALETKSSGGIARNLETKLLPKKPD